MKCSFIATKMTRYTNWLFYSAYKVNFSDYSYYFKYFNISLKHHLWRIRTLECNTAIYSQEKVSFAYNNIGSVFFHFLQRCTCHNVFDFKLAIWRVITYQSNDKMILKCITKKKKETEIFLKSTYGLSRSNTMGLSSFFGL